MCPYAHDLLERDLSKYLYGNKISLDFLCFNKQSKMINLEVLNKLCLFERNKTLHQIFINGDVIGFRTF